MRRPPSCLTRGSLLRRAWLERQAGQTSKLSRSEAPLRCTTLFSSWYHNTPHRCRRPGRARAYRTGICHVVTCRWTAASALAAMAVRSLPTLPRLRLPTLAAWPRLPARAYPACVFTSVCMALRWNPKRARTRTDEGR